ncbi:MULTISPECIES: nitroreductase/quinone reductase family protein [Actinoalloteichus]|uniref:Deazaflavin-dependent oxidoreductase, nitroreductase family n=1 Tax=Actinoalloteichus fjordicus TaxID=1612552 RepID=A0AAC9LDR3_9PSEU|nr:MULTISPECIES: nitroreductase/quinone reductase family protein [Actinoalloteichus]APU15762.1 deazaflavin-dependent oxidoreductase, nitroreductase family [Actinoalloteichus fjordicus]APU21822.1 deazaflavin-dependent oxidoreductase, nitroreductase family [Actinoalloteichus sp. GBA129-24]
MNAQRVLQWITSAHQTVYQRTDGRLGHRLLTRPTLLLTTTGRRSGMPRTACLVYAKDGEDHLVVASNWGSERAPAWLHNLRAARRSEIQVARRRTAVTAEECSPDHPDHPRLWEIVNRVNRDLYRQYAKKLRRPLSVIRLTPVTGAAHD